MKIKSKINLIFLILIILVIFSAVFISIFLKQNYKYIKYSQAHKYEEINNPSSEEYANYLIQKGFIVTRTQIDNYQNLVCHKEEITGYDDGVPVFYATINENILNDVLILIDYILAGIIVIVLILLIILYYIFNRLILKRIVHLENAMVEYSENSNPDEVLEKIEVTKYKDEISALELNFQKMLEQIKQNEIAKQKLIVALSHELKSPLVKIEAILNMYDQNISGYDEKDKVISLIKEEENKMLNNINNLLEFYNNYEENSKLEKVNIVKSIEVLFEDDIFKSKNMTFEYEYDKDFSKELQVNKFNIVLNNIKNNIYNHSPDNSKVLIKFAGEGVTFENEIKEKESKSSKVGNIINDYLADDLNIDIKKDITKQKYKLTLMFNK